MIVDFHTHCFPDQLAERVIPQLAECANSQAFLNGTISDLLKSMSESGVDYSVMLQIATKPSQNHTVNTWAIERDEPGIIAFGSVHVLGENWEEELERLAAEGIKGIKLHPEYQGVYVDDDVMLPLYEKISELGLYLAFHAGADIGIPPPVHSSPEHFHNVIDALPRDHTILAHMGGWKRWDEVEKFLVGSHLLFDSSFSYNFMPHEQMRRIIVDHGADKILMGSDSPWDSQEEAIKAIRSLELSEEEEEAVLGGNACRILNLKERK
ncbi:MAG: amidohydrolase family protein [Lentisphaerae bacterium]|nr:amidohydrolase family protein [Lentisphaerota bacterium]